MKNISILRRIEYFLAVAEEQHFGRAAERLHMSQPPLSHQIRLLEKALGVELFVRTTRRVELTAAGRELLAGARQSLAQLDHAIASAQRIHGGAAGVLRLGFVSTVASRKLSEWLHGYRERHPDVELQLFHLTSAQQAAALQEGSIDVGFCRAPPGGNVRSRVLVREALFAALPEGHPLAGKRRLRVDALRNEPFVMWDREQTSGIALTALSVCRKHGIEPRVALEVTNPSAMLGFVADGVGVAIVPDSMHLLKPAGVVLVPLEDRTTSNIAIAWREDNRSRLVPDFVEGVTQAGERKAREVPLQAKRVARATGGQVAPGRPSSPATRRPAARSPARSPGKRLSAP